MSFHSFLSNTASIDAYCRDKRALGWSTTTSRRNQEARARLAAALGSGSGTCDPPAVLRRVADVMSREEASAFFGCHAGTAVRRELEAALEEVALWMLCQGLRVWAAPCREYDRRIHEILQDEGEWMGDDDDDDLRWGASVLLLGFGGGEGGGEGAAPAAQYATVTASGTWAMQNHEDEYFDSDDDFDGIDDDFLHCGYSGYPF